jgi:hypothetical protein
MKLLKQKTSGEIYIWDEALAKREDMEEFVKEAPVEAVLEEQVEQEQVSGSENPAEVNEELTPVEESKPKKKAK